MDKGKKPIQEEEDFLSLFDDYQPNEILTPLAPPEYSVLSEGSGSAKQTPAVEEMEVAEEDFFSKFLSMNFSEQPDMEYYSKVAQANKDLLQLAPNVSISPRAPAPAAPANSNPIKFRKTMPPHELEKLALFDPKRAKRIMTNRLSASRAKEKKKLYIFMLEHNLNSLQSKSTKMSARLTLLLTESNSLNAENTLLKDRMGMVVQQIRLHDSLNSQIRSEIQHMKTMLRQLSSSGNKNPAMNVPLAAQESTQLQPQNPYQQQQQLQYDFQQPYLGKHNFGVQYEEGESSQLQQPQQQHPELYDHYQLQNEQVQAQHLQQQQQQQQQLPYFEHLSRGDYNIEDSMPSPSENINAFDQDASYHPNQ